MRQEVKCIAALAQERKRDFLEASLILYTERTRRLPCVIRVYRHGQAAQATAQTADTTVGTGHSPHRPGRARPAPSSDATAYASDTINFFIVARPDASSSSSGHQASAKLRQVECGCFGGAFGDRPTCCGASARLDGLELRV